MQPKHMAYVTNKECRVTLTPAISIHKDLVPLRSLTLAVAETRIVGPRSLKLQMAKNKERQCFLTSHGRWEPALLLCSARKGHGGWTN